MNLTTCNGCTLKGNCRRAKLIRQSLAGLSVTAVKFRCPDRRWLYHPGDPVWFQSWSSLDGETYQVWWPGWVISQKGTRVYGFIAPGTLDDEETTEFEAKSNGYVNFPIARVSRDPVREPRPTTACQRCGELSGITERCGYGTEYDDGQACQMERGPTLRLAAVNVEGDA